MTDSPSSVVPPTSATAAAAKKPAAKKKERKWAPRMWIGMCYGTWTLFLIRNRFQVSFCYWYKAVLITLVSFLNTAQWLVESLILGPAIRRTKIQPRPLIILGHWRSGTTWLHELLGLDPQFTSPSTYQVMAPNHFTISHWWVTRVFYWLMPSRRPMDNMPMGWDRPQEDEFALCNLGIPSPYLTIAFPNRPPAYQEYLTLDVSEAERTRWKNALYHFLQKVTFLTGKRLIIKSPTHTARVRTLLEMFPDARFIYIVRDPYVLFPSTVHLWKRLYETHGLQVPTFAGLEEHVLSTFTRIYDRFEADRALIPPERLYEVRYEDLVADARGRMEEIYRQLELGDYSQVRPAIEKYLAENADYQTNKYSLTDEQRAAVRTRWRPFIEKYGYGS
ncbi:MAG: sulfotransferase [Planctomycetes bacterium]|nr:sulfotransferase [Planctomycetota bacterium]